MDVGPCTVKEIEVDTIQVVVTTVTSQFLYSVMLGQLSYDNRLGRILFQPLRLTAI